MAGCFVAKYGTMSRVFPKDQVSYYRSLLAYRYASLLGLNGTDHGRK